METGDLSGTTLGQYRVEDRLGQGPVATVYRATQAPGDRRVALKVLDPSRASGPGFMQRCLNLTVTASKLQHPNILPVYEIGKRGQLSFLSMRLIRGGTLGDVLASRPRLDAGSVCRILGPVAGALHSAHEAGIVHQDLKPSNVLLEQDGTTLLADFGQARVYYGFAVGTPGYMSPEQAMGLEIDRRSDVHALGLMAFEMLTGELPYRGEQAMDLILAAVNDPVPAARRLNPELSQDVEEVLFRALAKDPAERPPTVLQLLEELGQAAAVRRRRVTPLPGWLARVATGPAISEPAVPSGDLQLTALINASPEPAVAIDGTFTVTHCNLRAETLFGWPKEQLIGQPVLQALVAPRYREVLERIFATYMADRRHPEESHTVEIVAMSRDGRQIPIELSFSPIELAPGQLSLVAFCHDVSARMDTEKLQRLQEAVAGALAEPLDAETAMPGVLEAVCSSLDWAAGFAWWRPPDGSALLCQDVWRAPFVEGLELETLSRSAACERGTGVPGQAWASGQPVWHSDLARVAQTERELAALRAGLQAVGAFPVLHEGEVLGVLEFFSATAGRPGEARLAEVAAISGRASRIVRRARQAPAEATAGAPRVVRYKVDGRNSHIGFSCAFMKLMTVHGIFRDFTGWLEIEDDDPLTGRAECRIKTASVDTGSQTRDSHLCSEDFFAVEQHPYMSFKSTRVERAGEDRYYLEGDLTIRNVSRPVGLDLRLEDREKDASGVERGTLIGSALLYRSDWFLDWEQALEAGRWLVGEEVRLDLVIALVHRPESGSGH